MQTSQEELKSTNEEFQSTNEELQSTNEELTTSKEEMQSLNEELQTVNAELQTKVDDLSWVNNDMQNLLNSTEIATIFLDNSLKLRRFTTHATDLFKLIPSDVGRPLSDIVNVLDYPNLQKDASEVLRTLAFVENQICTHDKRWFKVRIMPYRTQDNVINGVVITFAEITDLKKLEAELLKYANK
jgi:transcriptional regulator with PAS, ATPase and Fis domain